MDDRRRSSALHATDGVARVDHASIRKLSAANPEFAAVAAEANDATTREHQMTIRDAARLYPKAIMFSIAFSTAVVMEGYDLSLTGSFFGFPAFKEKYGTEWDPENPGKKLIGSVWQTGITNGVQAGSILGLMLNGWVSDRFGYKKTMIGALIAMIATIFIPFFAPSIGALVAGAVLQGIPWGIFQTLTVTYASDICPVALRPYLTTYVNLCWVFGQLIAAGVLRAFLTREDEWAYRIPYALQWVWPVIIMPFVLVAPESPWWLVRHHREADARRSLLSLTRASSGVPFDVDETVSMMKATNELELSLAESTTYWQCFRGLDLRRTEITSCVWLTQAFCGASLMGYSVQFYQQAGLKNDAVFDFNMAQYGMGAMGTIASWFIMPHVGRRTLYIWGLVLMLALLLSVGFAGIADRMANGENAAARWAIGSLLLVYTLVYGVTVGPVCYSLVTDIPSTRLKIKSVVLARNFYNIAHIINNIIMPKMLLPSEWNWGAYSGFFWAGACGLIVVWCYFRLPEPKGRTYAELDILFENRVSARKFATTKVDQLPSHSNDHFHEVNLDGEKGHVKEIE